MTAEILQSVVASLDLLFPEPVDALASLLYPVPLALSQLAFAARLVIVVALAVPVVAELVAGLVAGLVPQRPVESDCPVVAVKLAASMSMDAAAELDCFFLAVTEIAAAELVWFGGVAVRLLVGEIPEPAGALIELVAAEHDDHVVVAVEMLVGGLLEPADILPELVADKSDTLDGLAAELLAAAAAAAEVGHLVVVAVDLCFGGLVEPAAVAAVAVAHVEIDDPVVLVVVVAAELLVGELLEPAAAPLAGLVVAAAAAVVAAELVALLELATTRRIRPEGHVDGEGEVARSIAVADLWRLAVEFPQLVALRELVADPAAAHHAHTVRRTLFGLGVELFAQAEERVIEVLLDCEHLVGSIKGWCLGGWWLCLE